ncbi:MAG: PAS domain S-box protein, partial [Ignavibacteriaceae bacterium]
IIPTIEYRFKHTNGEYIWIESTFNNLLNEPSVEAIIINFRDISYRKKAEEKLRTLSRAVEQSPAIMVITDTNGDIEFVNPKFTEVTGYTFEEARGKNPRILKSGHTTQQEYKELWKLISEKNEWRGEFFNRKKNGELYWESAYITPILNEFGEITNYIALKEDITERKNLLADLIEAKEKAEEMNRVKAYFFANMSHELRTPFVGIVGFSELLSESLQNPEEKEMANQILKSSKRLTETLNKILNVTRLEFDKLEVKLRDIDVIEMIDQLKILFSKSASAKNISIKTKISQDEIVVKTDGRMLDEMITNLLNNAIKYTQDGFIDISAETIVRENKNYLLLKVADTGVGIPKNKQEIIWKEFRQVSEGMNRSFEGTGLGLTIIKKYVETLSGKITLESEIGKGSTFVIEIPVEIVSKKEVNKSKEVVLKQTQNNIEIKSRKPKILYVEDDVIALSYVDKVLKAFYEIDTAFNATIALELANKNIYEAMLLDINLGKGIDGVELMQMMRKINGYNKIPIVAVTAYAAESDRLEFLAKGFTHYLSKPFTSVELRGMLGKIFNS